MTTGVSTVINRQDPAIEAYRLGLLEDTQQFIQQQNLGREVQALRQRNPNITDAEIASMLSVPGQEQVGTEGEEGFIPGSAGFEVTPDMVAGISGDTLYAPPDYQVAGLSLGEQAAVAQAQQGIGAYSPDITTGAETLQGGVTGITGAALPYMQTAAGALAGADAQFTPLGGTYRSPFESTAAGYAQQGAEFADAGAQGIAAASDLGTTAAERGMVGADLASERARSSTAAAQQALGAAGQKGMVGADLASERARASTAAAQKALAASGAQLADTTAAFDPQGIGSFMNQYEDAAVQQALKDIGRAGQKQQAELGASAVSAGAFGGARQGVAQAEIGRNVLEQQGRTAAQMRQAGFESAAARAQDAFERAMGRGQSAAQLMGSLAQQSGALGLSAEQLAQSGALQGAQLGTQAAQQAGALGLSAEQLAQAGALQGSGLGLSAAEQAARNAQAFGQLGLAGADARMRGAAAQEASYQTAQARAAQDFEAARQRQLQGAGLYGTIGQGIGSLSAQLGQLGIQQAGLGEMRTALGTQDLQNLLATGALERGVSQAGLDAQRLSNLQAYSQPYQQYGFLSDIYSGVPTGSSTITAASAPQISPFQSMLGLGIAGLSAYGGAKSAGIF